MTPGDLVRLPVEIRPGGLRCWGTLLQCLGTVGGDPVWEVRVTYGRRSWRHKATQSSLELEAEAFRAHERKLRRRRKRRGPRLPP